MRKIGSCLALSVAVASHAVNIDLSGKVTNSSGAAISNAVVTLVGQGRSDTTGADGAYSITSTTSVHSSEALGRSLSVEGGILTMDLPEAAPVKVEVFDVNGALVRRVVAPEAQAGRYSVDIAGGARMPGVLFARVSVGSATTSLRCLPLAGGRYEVSSSSTVEGLARSAASAVFVDTLKVSATGYVPRLISLKSLDSTLDIVLDSSDTSFGYPMGNVARPSTGCGKSTLSSGTYYMTVDGFSRYYILHLPGNYNSAHPYRLIFAMHYMNGSASAMVSEDYYRLRPLDTDSSAIYVAPQGYTESYVPWSGDDRDHLFFDSMVTVLKSNLCVDTTRVFSVGWSFGSMFTNSLGQNHQKVLRAVAVYSTAQINIYEPTNTGLPLAWMGSVGQSDQLCYPYMGRAARNRFVQNNGGDSSLVTTYSSTNTAYETYAGSGTHKCYDYATKSRFPVKWCTFDGGHSCTPTDNGSTTTWIPALTWKFLTQF